MDVEVVAAVLFNRQPEAAAAWVDQARKAEAAAAHFSLLRDEEKKKMKMVKRKVSIRHFSHSFHSFNGHMSTNTRRGATGQSLL